MTSSARSHAADTVRLAALLGICLVNMPFMGLAATASPVVPAAIADQLALFVLNAAFQAKFFLLFSFLFGWGFEIQDRAAARAGANFSGRYLRRLCGLALLGCLHALLVFSGDILLLYAALGLLLWPLRRFNAGALWRMALALLPLAMLVMIALALLLPQELPPAARMGLGGSYAEAVRTRLGEWPSTFIFLLLFQGPLAFAAFLAGLAAARADFFEHDNPARRRLGKAAPWLLALALPLNVFYAITDGGWLRSDDGSTALLGLCALSLGAPLMAAVYLDAVLGLAQRIRPPPLLLQAARNSLSSYVLQGVLAGFVFGGYGLGLFERLGYAALAGVAVLVALTAMLAVGITASRWGRGPLEALLRWLTYGRAPPATQG